jgi:hypothetical protein
MDSQEQLPLSRQELNQLLLSLEQLKQNEVFNGFLLESKDIYERGLTTVLESAPKDLAQFVARERMIGALAETKKFLDLISVTEVDLNQKLNEHNAKRN